MRSGAGAGPGCVAPIDGRTALGKRREPVGEPELTALIGGVVDDARTLIDQQIDLLRVEVAEELGRARDAVASMGVGAGLLATGGVLSAFMLVHGVHRSTRLPLWGCYGLVGGLLGVAGAALLAAGRREAAGLRLVPPQTLEALKENLAWIQDQAGPTPNRP